LASGSEDKTIKLWNVEQQKELNTLQAQSGHIRSVIFSPDSKYLASGSEDKTVKLWKVDE
jgi:WD40 repeat protein